MKKRVKSKGKKVLKKKRVLRKSKRKDSHQENLRKEYMPFV